jgi:malate permease and related proteins
MILFLLACLPIGAVLKRWLPPDSVRTINQLLIYVCLPALTLLHTAELRFEARYALPVLMPWVVFGGSWTFFALLGSRLGLSAQSRTALTLTAGIPSVSFVGFPIFEWLYGAEGLKIGVLMSQAGSFLVCSTLGVLLASYYGQPTGFSRDRDPVRARPTAGQLLRNVLMFPTFGAFVLALGMNLAGWSWPPVVRDVLVRLGSPFSFLALVSVGLQLDIRRESWRDRALAWGLGYKLLLAPALIAVLLLLLKQRGPMAEICVLGAGLGPMNTVAVIAARYGLDPPLVARMVGIGIPLSILTVLLFRLLFVAG